MDSNQNKSEQASFFGSLAEQRLGMLARRISLETRSTDVDTNSGNTECVTHESANYSDRLGRKSWSDNVLATFERGAAA